MIAHYTVVYRVDGEEAVHDAWWQSIQPLFLAESEPVSISMVSKADEVARLDGIKRIVEGGMTADDKVRASTFSRNENTVRAKDVFPDRDSCRAEIQRRANATKEPAP